MKKITLHRETVRNLDAGDLVDVQGGVLPKTKKCPILTTTTKLSCDPRKCD